MVIGNYFLGNKKEALKYAKKGKDTSVDAYWKNYFNNLVNDLTAGTDVFKWS